MRLLHLVPSVDPQGGGVIEGVRRIHDALAAMGHTGDVVSLDSPDAPCVSAYPGPVVATGPSVSSYGYNERLLPWLKAQEDAQLTIFDANDWLYQTWAYEKHDVGATPGMGGDMAKALGAIRARTLILTGTKDLLNPEYEPQDAARFIRDVRVVTISPGTVTGHAAAGGVFPADVAFLNREIGRFLDTATGRKRE